MSRSTDEISGYSYSSAEANQSHSVLLKPCVRALEEFFVGGGRPRRVFDLGCGNGSVAALLARHGYEVSGVDPSREGIAQANVAYPHLRLEAGSAYDDLVSRFGRFPAVISLEVVEHVYAPRDYAKTLYDLLEPGGLAILSTPYHGYIKNLALAVSNRMDSHFTALWDHGHIKFWSIATLGKLLREVGLRELAFSRVGRIPPVAKSMIVVARKPPV